MFFLKKLVSQFLFPMPLCLYVCFGGVALLWWTKKQKTGKMLVSCGLLLLTLLSLGPVADQCIYSLECRYPTYQHTENASVKYVVVLGAGHNSDPRLALTSQISD